MKLDICNASHDTRFGQDFSVPTLEYVTRTPFSRDDSVLYHNETGWFLTVHRHVGGVQYVAEPSIEMESMATREDHGEWSSVGESL